MFYICLIWFVLPADKVSRVLFHISFLYLIFVGHIKTDSL